jgi:hypothetical protein
VRFLDRGIRQADDDNQGLTPSRVDFHFDGIGFMPMRELILSRLICCGVSVSIFVEARRHNDSIAFAIHADFDLSLAPLIVSIAVDDIRIAPFHSTVLNMNISAMAAADRPTGIQNAQGGLRRIGLP